MPAKTGGKPLFTADEIQAFVDEYGPTCTQAEAIKITGLSHSTLQRAANNGELTRSGRNALTWEEKFALDVQYVDSHTFLGDLRILWRTIAPVFGCRGIAADGVATMSEFRGPPDA